MNKGPWGIVDTALSDREGKSVWLACQCFLTEDEAEEYRKDHFPLHSEVRFDYEFVKDACKCDVHPNGEAIAYCNLHNSAFDLLSIAKVALHVVPLDDGLRNKWAEIIAYAEKGITPNSHVSDPFRSIINGLIK